MHLDFTIAHIGRYGAGRESDRIGVDHFGDVAVLAARHPFNDRVNIEARRQHFVRDDERIQDDLPGKPKQIERHAPDRNKNIAPTIKQIHA